MAEVALTSIAKSALQLFTSLARDESLLLWNSEKELKRLHDSIDTVGCLLQDADRLQSNAAVVQNCLSKLRGFMYDAEDFFDGLAAQVLRKKTMDHSVVFPKEVRLFFSESNQIWFIVKTAHEVKSLRESLDAIRQDMNLCGFRLLDHPPVAQQVIRFDRERTHSFVHERDVIGRDGEREAIVDLLLHKGDTSDNRSFSVVAVIGFGGLGKTTLAQLVYNDRRVKQGFDVCLWACINYLSKLDQVLIEIIASKERRHSDLGLEKLQEKLREIIGGRKFLVVLDDLWDEDSGNWLHLETILRCGKIGSKVIVTTRSQKVAECLDASKPCSVELGGLSDESAWSLFVKKAFHKGELDNHPELEPVGKEIVKSCRNVPLAIIVIGSLLRHRPKEERIWSHFFEYELGKALSNSDGVRSHKSMKDVLMVSYNDLDPNLKLCFAYCSLFRKDYDFDRDELVHLWIAQGFVKPSAYNEQSLEEMGEKYFFQLVERCFFQEVKEFYYKESIYCWRSYGNHLYGHSAKMHDLLHDMAIDVARTESILLDNVSIGKGKRESLRHVSIDSGVDDFFDHRGLVVEPKSIRTLLFHPSFMHERSLDISMLESFRMLRTLGLQDCGITVVPDSIGELIHLRYLNLSNNENLQYLPRSICKLHHLMTLILVNCEDLENLPLKIENLVSLRALYIDGCDRLDCLPSGLTALTSLVHLDRLIVHHDSGGLGYLNGLDNLHGVLRIELPKEGWPDAIGDAKRSNMLKKKKLDGIIIEWKEIGSDTSQEMGRADAEAVLDALEPHKSRLEYLEIKGYGGEKLPRWFCMLENLKKLRLYGCENVEYIEDEMKGSVCFPSLRTLKFESMKNLKGWWRQEKHEGAQRSCLAKVPNVTTNDCPELKGGMPLFEGIEYLYLQRVDVKLVTEILSPNCSSDQASFAPCDNSNKLKTLYLRGIKGLVKLPSNVLQNLCDLDIGFDEGESICHLPSSGIHNLRSLENLDIGRCKELYLGWKTLISMKLDMLKLHHVGRVIDVEDMVVEQPTQLRFLIIEDTREARWIHDIPWKSLASSLYWLQFADIDGMEEVPDGIQHLTSLGVLYIIRCEKVRSVPKWLPHLTSLTRLLIWDCSEELERRCERERGEDWPLIRHIPRIEIGSGEQIIR